MCFFFRNSKRSFFLNDVNDVFERSTEYITRLKEVFKEKLRKHTVTSMLKISQVSLNVSLFSMVF